MTRWVVDTSVARAAGVGAPGSAQPAPHCVAALDAITVSDGTVVLSEEQRLEWHTHARPYARKWLHQMLSRRRFHKVDRDWDGVVALLDAAADLPGGGPGEIAKDIHLVSMAMRTDRKVISLDARQRVLLRRLAKRVPVVCSIEWGTPDGERCCAWIHAGGGAYGLCDDGS